MGIILMVLMFLIGGYLLGITWVLVFWVSSFLFYLMSWFLSKIGIYMGVAGDKMIWLLFLVVCGISYWTFNIIKISVGSGDIGTAVGGTIFVFLSGNFMLFKSADTWRVGE